MIIWIILLCIIQFYLVVVQWYYFLVHDTTSAHAVRGAACLHRHRSSAACAAPVPLLIKNSIVLFILRSSFIGIFVVLSCYSRKMTLLFTNSITLFMDSSTAKSASIFWLGKGQQYLNPARVSTPDHAPRMILVSTGVHPSHFFTHFIFVSKG